MKLGLSRFSGYGPFTGLRTRPMHPATETPPRRPCASCGAILRRSNPGPLCAPCTGAVEIPEWVSGFAELDDRPSTVAMLAALLTGEHKDYRRVECVDEIVQMREAGMSHGAIAKACGLKKAGVQGVLWRKERREGRK